MALLACQSTNSVLSAQCSPLPPVLAAVVYSAPGDPVVESPHRHLLDSVGGPAGLEALLAGLSGSPLGGAPSGAAAGSSGGDVELPPLAACTAISPARQFGSLTSLEEAADSPNHAPNTPEALSVLQQGCHSEGGTPVPLPSP